MFLVCLVSLRSIALRKEVEAGRHACGAGSLHVKSVCVASVVNSIVNPVFQIIKLLSESIYEI